MFYSLAVAVAVAVGFIFILFYFCFVFNLGGCFFEYCLFEERAF